MRAALGKVSQGRIAAAGLALALACPAAAQNGGSVNDYRLPDPNQTATPRVQGPVDPENPYSRSATGSPERTPSPTPTPAPAPTTTSAPRIEVPAPSTTPAARPAPRATATPNARPTNAGETQRPAASPSPDIAEQAPSLPVPAAEPSAPSAVATDDAPLVIPSAKAQPRSSTPWMIGGVMALLVLAGAAFVFLRRRKPAEVEEVVAEPVVVEPVKALRSASPARPQPEPAPVTVPPPALSAPSAAEPLPIAISFAPRSLRLSLVYATLQYELEVTNAGDTPLPALQIRADLYSAHATISAAEQLAPAPQMLEAKHEVPALAPGESNALKGEVRVALQQVRPVAKGAAKFLVPLARFCILARDGTALRRVFTLGPRDPSGTAIASVRLDAGPRNLRELDSREIEAARSFVLDPVAVAG